MKLKDILKMIRQGEAVRIFDGEDHDEENDFTDDHLIGYVRTGHGRHKRGEIPLKILEQIREYKVIEVWQTIEIDMNAFRIIPIMCVRIEPID